MISSFFPRKQPNRIRYAGVFYVAGVLLLMPVSPSLGVESSAEPVRVGFESAEGYMAESAELPEAWTVEPESQVVIDAGEQAEGSQSLKLGEGTPPGVLSYSSQSIPVDGIRFIDVRIKPVGLSKSVAETTLAAWGSSLGFVDEGEGIQIAPVNGELPVSLVKTDLKSRSEENTGGWMRLTIRQDLSTQTWDLYVDGQLAAIDLALEKEGQAELLIFGSEQAPIWIDELSVDAENPLFADEDKDGMPDAEEEANGLNAYGNDRHGDRDGDGISNIEEALAGSSPRAPNGTGGTMSLASLIYVDNLRGSDGNQGLRSYAVGGDGPKASIKAAMAAARSGDTIVIMPGKGVYDEGSRGAPGKKLTIKALSNVTIK